eukprot:jgi/Bigna1/80248/fgenesh1_pg.69_\
MGVPIAQLKSRMHAVPDVCMGGCDSTDGFVDRGKSLFKVASRVAQAAAARSLVCHQRSLHRPLPVSTDLHNGHPSTQKQDARCETMSQMCAQGVVMAQTDSWMEARACSKWRLELLKLVNCCCCTIACRVKRKNDVKDSSKPSEKEKTRKRKNSWRGLKIGEVKAPHPGRKDLKCGEAGVPFKCRCPVSLHAMWEPVRLMHVEERCENSGLDPVSNVRANPRIDWCPQFFKAEDNCEHDIELRNEMDTLRRSLTCDQRKAMCDFKPFKSKNKLRLAIPIVKGNQRTREKPNCLLARQGWKIGMSVQSQISATVHGCEGHKERRRRKWSTEQVAAWRAHLKTALILVATDLNICSIGTSSVAPPLMVLSEIASLSKERGQTSGSSQLCTFAAKLSAVVQTLMSMLATGRFGAVKKVNTGARLLVAKVFVEWARGPHIGSTSHLTKKLSLEIPRKAPSKRCTNEHILARIDTFVGPTMDANVDSRKTCGEVVVALSERCNLDPHPVKVVLRCTDFKHPPSTLHKSSDFHHVHSTLNTKPFKLLKPQRLVPNSFQLVIAGESGNRPVSTFTELFDTLKSALETASAVTRRGGTLFFIVTCVVIALTLHGLSKTTLQTLKTCADGQELGKTSRSFTDGHLFGFTSRMLGGLQTAIGFIASPFTALASFGNRNLRFPQEGIKNVVSSIGNQAGALVDASKQSMQAAAATGKNITDQSLKAMQVSESTQKPSRSFQEDDVCAQRRRVQSPDGGHRIHQNRNEKRQQGHVFRPASQKVMSSEGIAKLSKAVPFPDSTGELGDKLKKRMENLPKEMLEKAKMDMTGGINLGKALGVVSGVGSDAGGFLGGVASDAGKFFSSGAGSVFGALAGKKKDSDTGALNTSGRTVDTWKDFAGGERNMAFAKVVQKHSNRQGTHPFNWKTTPNPGERAKMEVRNGFRADFRVMAPDGSILDRVSNVENWEMPLRSTSWLKKNPLQFISGPKWALTMAMTPSKCSNDPDDVKAREEMLVALRNGKATKLELALIRGALIKECDQFTFDAAAEEVATCLSTIRPPTRTITAWRDLFQPATNSRNSDVGDDVKAPAVENKSRIIKPTVVSEVTLNLPTCDGSRGEARRWWTDTKDKLEEAHPDANDAAKTTWSMLTKKSLENTCKSGSERVNQLKVEHKMQGGTDVCALMEEFVGEMDLNSLPVLPNKWRAVRQKDSETAIDHRTRCANPVRDLGHQGCKVAKEQKLAMFKNTLLVKAHMQSLDDTKTDTFAKAASEANDKETSNDQNETKGSLNMMNRHGAPETAMCFKTDEKRCGWCKGKDCCASRCPRKARGLPETTWKRLKDVEKKRKDGRDKQKGAHPRSRRGRLHNVKANEVLAGLLKHRRGEGSANAAPHKTTNSGLTRDKIAQLQSTLGSQSDQGLSSEEIAQVVGCNNASEQIRDLEMPTASEGNEGLKISMARAKMNNREVTALLDSGSIPLSCIAMKKVQELGLSGKANVHRSDHGTAKKGGGFSSMGTLETDVSIPGATVRLPAKLHVTGDTSTNCILRRSLRTITERRSSRAMKPRGRWHTCPCCLLENGKNQRMHRPPTSNATHLRLRNVRNVTRTRTCAKSPICSSARQLDDWSAEQGRRCVQALSKRKCKNITMPRKGPSPDIDPARMELKEGHESDIVHVPEPSRPQVDHEKMRWQVRQVGKPKSVADPRSFLAMAGWILKRCATTCAQTAAAFTTAHRKPNDKEPFAKVWGEANSDEPCDKLKGMISSELMRNTPLLGIHKNHETANEQFANVRSKTEEFDDTRRIRHVPGDEQLADTWSRPFQRPPADFVPDTLHNLFEDDSGFVPDTKESAASVVEAELKKLRIRRLEDRVEVFTGGEWRTCVPKRQRLRLLCEAHGNDHASDTNMAMRLSKCCWSKKPPDSRQHIQGCKCAALKAAGTPRHESKSSKSSGRICAKERFDVVQIDMHKCSGVWHMTFVDAATGEPWIRRICKVGMAKRNKGVCKAKVHNECRCWESENGTPKKLHVDDEVTPIALPHPNVQPGPVDRPQNDAMVERLHRVIAALCRVHGTTPDSIRHLLPFFTRPSGGASKKKDDSKTSVKCDGRITKTGTLVRARKPTRSREKEDPFWNKVAKVTERIGKRVCRVWDGKRASDRFIDHLKNHSIGDDVLRHAEMNDETWDVARDTIGAKPDFDTGHDNTDCGFDDDWKNKTVFAGCPGRSNMERLLKKLKRGDHRSVCAAVPEPQCERWFSQLEDLSDSWHAVEIKDEDNFWQDDQGRDFRDEAIDWHLMKFVQCMLEKGEGLLHLVQDMFFCALARDGPFRERCMRMSDEAAASFHETFREFAHDQVLNAVFELLKPQSALSSGLHVVPRQHLDGWRKKMMTSSPINGCIQNQKMIHRLQDMPTDPTHLAQTGSDRLRQRLEAERSKMKANRVMAFDVVRPWDTFGQPGNTPSAAGIQTLRRLFLDFWVAFFLWQSLATTHPLLLKPPAPSVDWAKLHPKHEETLSPIVKMWNKLKECIQGNPLKAPELPKDVKLKEAVGVDVNDLNGRFVAIQQSVMNEHFPRKAIKPPRAKLNGGDVFRKQHVDFRASMPCIVDSALKDPRDDTLNTLNVICPTTNTRRNISAVDVRDAMPVHRSSLERIGESGLGIHASDDARLQIASQIHEQASRAHSNPNSGPRFKRGELQRFSCHFTGNFPGTQHFSNVKTENWVGFQVNKTRMYNDDACKCDRHIMHNDN